VAEIIINDIPVKKVKTHKIHFSSLSFYTPPSPPPPLPIRFFK
jgi:hypothetical protein